MWIRSQDKRELIDASHAYVNESNCIISVCGEAYCELGKYETRERALEVLDEIQDEMSELPDVSYLAEPARAIWVYLADMVRIKRTVYQMPKE